MTHHADPEADRRSPRRAIPLGVLGLIGLAVAVVAATAPNDPAQSAQGVDTRVGHHDLAMSGAHVQSAQSLKASEVAFHDEMRRLWEDHVTWTRLAIVTFAADSGGFNATAARLLQNQTDIGDAIKPFYGAAAGDQLSALLHDHITIAVELLTAAKTGDTAAFDDANARWATNANQIADLLSSVNPRSWPRDVLRASMRAHLDQTLAEAAHELAGEYAASVADYQEIHHHILAMADLLSSGIIKQFPSRFR